jgi:pimeloyl-ACP methyl ester carboxylesterase
VKGIKMEDYKRKTWNTRKRKIQYIYVPTKNKLSNSAILMFSGAGSDSFDWLPLIKNLYAFQNCLVVDKPGYFETTKGELDFQEQIVSDTFDVAENLGIKKVFLVGHSIGLLSALLFNSKHRGNLEILGICSLDGIVLDTSTIKLFKEMSSPKWLQFLQDRMVLDLGLFRKKITLNIKEYSPEFDEFTNYYEQDVQKFRNSKSHVKAIMEENKQLYQRLEKYFFLKKEKLPTSFLIIKAINKDGVEKSEEVKYFPHLKELILEVETKGNEWNLQLIEDSKGKKVEIIATHFLHGEFPELVASYINEFINNTAYNTVYK